MIFRILPRFLQFYRALFQRTVHWRFCITLHQFCPPSHPIGNLLWVMKSVGNWHKERLFLRNFSRRQTNKRESGFLDYTILNKSVKALIFAIE